MSSIFKELKLAEFFLTQTTRKILIIVHIEVIGQAFWKHMLVAFQRAVKITACIGGSVRRDKLKISNKHAWFSCHQFLIRPPPMVSSKYHIPCAQVLQC